MLCLLHIRRSRRHGLLSDFGFALLTWSLPSREEYVHINVLARCSLFLSRNKSTLIWLFSRLGLNKQPHRSTPVFSTGDSRVVLGALVHLAVRLSPRSSGPRRAIRA